MKQLTELTKEEAKEILEYVLKDQYEEYGWSFDKIHFKPSEPGRVTLGLRPAIGIGYKAGLNWDGFILHFDDTKCVYWLYEHGYDISDQLKSNSYMSEMETDFENFVFDLDWEFKDKNGDYISDPMVDKIKKLFEKYYYKDYV